MKQQAVNASAAGVLDASSTIKALVQDAPERRADRAHVSKDPSNPIYLLAAITLGIPALAIIALIGMNSGMQDGALATLTKLLVFSAFIVAVVFEIKLLADQPSGGERH